MGRYYITIIVFLCALIIPCPVYSDIYVSLSGNDTTGDGTISLPYETIQKGIDSLAIQGVGNTLYLRGGTYTEIPTDGTTRGFDCSGLTGTSWVNSYTIQSYPGEWAIIDGSNYPTEARFFCFNTNTNNFYGYLKFSHLEIKNCDGTTHSSAIVQKGGPFIFEYLYIHDNNCDTGSNNPAGITLENGSGNVTVQYCYFYQNGYLGGSNENSAQVAFFSDYKLTWGPQDLEDGNGYATARANNIVKYCLFDGNNGTSVGVKHKGVQFLENNILFEGTIVDVNSWYENGNDTHHNIFLNHLFCSVYLSTDFDQVHNNIATDAYLQIGYTNRDERPPSDVVIYNNTVIDSNRTGITGMIHDMTPSGNAYYERYWCFNNIVDNPTDYDSRQDITFKNLYSSGPSWDIDNLLRVQNNMFYKPQNTNLVKVLETAYTLSTLNSTSWASDNISDSYDAGDYLYNGTSGDDKYKLNPLYSLYSTMSLGGYGQSHPYLAGVTIPSYIGAVNPADDSWVAGVLALDATYMTDASGDPTWIEGSTPDTTPPTLDAINVQVSGNTTQFDFSENMAVGADSYTNFDTLVLSGGSVTLSGCSITNDVVECNNSRTVGYGETFVSFAYTQLGDGLQDIAATPNNLATISTYYGAFSNLVPVSTIVTGSFSAGTMTGTVQ